MSRPQAHVVASAASATPTEGRRLMSTSIAERRPSWSSTAAALSPTSPRCSGSPAKVSPTGWIPPPTPTTRPPWPMPTARAAPRVERGGGRLAAIPARRFPRDLGLPNVGWTVPLLREAMDHGMAEAVPPDHPPGLGRLGYVWKRPALRPRPRPRARILARWVPESGMRDFRDAHPPASWQDTCPLTDLPKCATMGWNRGGVRCRASLSREGFARAVPPPTPPAPLSPLPGGRDADGKCVALALGGAGDLGSHGRVGARSGNPARRPPLQVRHRCRGASCCCCASDNARDQPPAPVRPTWVESSTGPCLSAAPCGPGRRRRRRSSGSGRVACPRLRGHVHKPLAHLDMPTKTWACHPAPRIDHLLDTDLRT